MLIQSDDDWKNQAQKEKERLAAQQKERDAAAAKSAAAARPAADPRQQAAAHAPAPEANFQALVQGLSSQALMVMGTVADPRTGRPMLDLGAAKTSLDLLAMLEEKTRGNLTAEETTALQTALWSLRDTFVRVAWATRSTAA